MAYKQELCSSCGKPIAPFERSVHFSCPKCGDVTVWRCERCREFARSYSCPKCSFSGP